MRVLVSFFLTLSFSIQQTGFDDMFDVVLPIPAGCHGVSLGVQNLVSTFIDHDVNCLRMHDHLPIKYWGDYNSAQASFVFRFFSFVSSLFSFALSLSLSRMTLSRTASLSLSLSLSLSTSPSLPLSLNRFFRWKTTDDTLSFFACFPETTYVHCSVLPWELGEAGVIFSTVSPFHRSSISSIPPSVLSSQIGLGSLGVARPDALACGDFHLWCSSWVVSALRLCTLFFCLFNLISVVALILMISYQ